MGNRKTVSPPPGNLSGVFDTWTAAEGRAQADELLRQADVRAQAKAAQILAASECPATLIEWGKAHGIPNFARVTWQDGFLAGMRKAALDDLENSQDLIQTSIGRLPANESAIGLLDEALSRALREIRNMKMGACEQ